MIGKMPITLSSSKGRLKKFTPACPAFAEAASRRQAKRTHFGVQARSRWTLNETGFVAVTLTHRLFMMFPIENWS